MQFVMFLAGGVSAFHFQNFLDILGSCPAPMAIGETASGKSTCLRIIQQLLGGVFLSQSSGESVTSELMKSTLPVYWDDPAHPNTLKKVLVSTFQGGGKQAKGGGNEVPLTTFLMTVNFTLDDDMRAFERTTPIMFEKILTASGSGHMDFFDSKKRVMQHASTRCIASIIKMGADLEECDLEEHVHFFTTKLVGLPSRLPSIYSCYRYFAFKITDLVAQSSVISCSEFHDYVTKSLIPYVTMLYGKSRKVKATLDQLMKDIVAAVENGPSENVFRWLKPSVKQRASQTHHGDHGAAAVHLHRGRLLSELTKAGSPYSVDDIRDMCSGITGANHEFRSSFEEQGQKDVSIKIPRDAIEENTLNLIDSWFGDRRDENTTTTEQIECLACPKLKKELDSAQRKIKHLRTKLKEQKEQHQKKVQELKKEIKLKKSDGEKKEPRTYSSISSSTLSLKRRLTEVGQPTSVPRAVAELIGECASTEGQSSLNDSGVFEDDAPDSSSGPNEVQETSGTETDSAQTGMPSERDVKKRKFEDKGKCNLCPSKKKSGMIVCGVCQQWQHFKCVGIKLEEAKITKFICTFCVKLVN